MLAHGTVGDAGGRSTERPYVRRTILRHVILVLTDVAMDAARAGGERDGVLSGIYFCGENGRVYCGSDICDKRTRRVW